MAPAPIGKRDKGPLRFIVLQGTISYGAFIEGAEFRDYGPPQEPRGIIDPRDTMHQEGITAVSLIPSRSDRFIPRQIDLLFGPFLCPISREKNHAGTSVLRVVSLRRVATVFACVRRIASYRPNGQSHIYGEDITVSLFHINLFQFHHMFLIVQE